MARIAGYVASVAVLLAALALPRATAPVLHRDTSRAGTGKLDRALRDLVARGTRLPLRVVIQIAPGGRAAVDRALQADGGSVIAELPIINGVAAAVPAERLLDLAAVPAVRVVSSDGAVDSASALPLKPPVVASALDDRTAQLPLTAMYRTLGIDLASTGYGVGVAIVDSGIGGSLAPQVVNSFDFTKGSKVVQVVPCDDYGHGTFVAGLVADQGVRSWGTYGGVAPNVRLLSLKVLDKTGSGQTSDVVRAIQFAVQNRSLYGIDVINLSLGHPIYEASATDPLVQAVERAVQSGIVVVTAAGNYGVNARTGEVGYAGITSPGNAPSAITVGAFDTHDTPGRSDDTMTSFSSRGPTWYDGFSKPDLVAPGRRDIATIAPEGSLYASLAAASPDRLFTSGGPGDHETARYLSLSGTSMAAAITSGVIARVLQSNRTLLRPAATMWAPSALSPKQVKLILEYTALVMPVYDPLTQGAGALNAAGAETVARSVDPRIPAGQPWLVSAVTPSTVIEGEALPWGERVIWGDRVIWGGALVVNNDPAIAQAGAWGDPGRWGGRVVWSDSTVWDTRAIWGDRAVWGAGTIAFPSPNQAVWSDVVRRTGAAGPATSFVNFFID